MINRTAEKVLSIIAAIFSFLGMLTFLAISIFVNMAKNDPTVMDEFREVMLSDGSLTLAEVDMFMEFFNVFANFIWIGALVAFISLVLNLIGLAKMRNNPNVAGTLFIVAGLVNGILSLTSVLLYIAGILCFTKKPPMDSRPIEEEYVANQSNWMN